MYKDTRHDFIRAMSEYEQYRASCGKKSYGCITPKKGYSRYKTVLKIVPVA